MGVSLERVQFKFASIVGELCNDPDILSQFAVWLDLRLAEYKLKGAISLDCSGEEPDADWMNGLKKCKKCGSQQHHHGTSPQRARQLSNSSQKYSYQQSTSNPEIYPWDSGNSRLSPEVKSENQEVHVVPMELHMNSVRTNSLKRPRNADSWSHSRESPSKRPFMSSTNPSSDNQSLLSVIGGDVDSTNQQENDDDVIQVIEADTLQTSQHSHSDSRAGNSPAETSMSNDQFLLESSQKSNTDSTSQQGTSHEDPNNIWVNQQGTSPTKGVDESRGQISGSHDNHEVQQQRISRSLEKPDTFQHPATLINFRRSSLETSVVKKRQNEERKKKIPADRLLAIPHQSIISMVAAVGTFERWLWLRTEDESRSILDIPEEELDSLLAEFFQVVVTPTGENYTRNSFTQLRSYIMRYLKECGYPQPADLFHKSAQTFRLRQKRLSAAFVYTSSSTNSPN